MLWAKTTAFVLSCLGIIAAVDSLPHKENESPVHGEETSKQLVLSPQEVQLLQLQQTLQQQQTIALAEANKKLLERLEEDDSDEDDDDVLDDFSRSSLPEDSGEIFPDRRRNDVGDVVFAIVDHGEELREAATDSVSAAPEQSTTTQYVNVPVSDSPAPAADETVTSSPLVGGAPVSTESSASSSLSTVAVGGLSSSTVTVDGLTSSSVAVDGISSSTVTADGLTSSSVAVDGLSSSTVAGVSPDVSSAVPDGVSSTTLASASVSSVTPESPPNPAVTASVSTVSPGVGASNASTPNSVTGGDSESSTTGNEIDNGADGFGASTSATSTTTKPRKRLPYRASLRCRCGTQTTRRLTFGSTKVITNTYPWTVSITRNATHMCTGNIINSQYVLTSASCLHGSKARDLIVRAALSNPSKRTVYNVKSISYHPDYRPQNQVNNLALVEVQEDFRPSKSVKFVCLPLEDSQKEPDCGTIVAVSEEPSTKNLTMIQQQVQRIPDSRCGFLLRKKMTNETFCTAPPSRRCDGRDTGGAYITPGKGYSFTLKGLVNSSSGCKIRRQPAVFTMVSRYTSWILYKTQQASYCKVPSFRRELAKFLPE